MMARVLRRMIPERFRPIGYLTRLVRQRTGSTVRQGPFAGMRYTDRAIGSAYLPKLLGTYERELARLIEAGCALRPSLIVNLGAGEGYYAVGLALRNPQARVLAFEKDPAGRSALAEMAQRNGVEQQVHIQGECDPATLQATLATHLGRLPPGVNRLAFVLCDVEGDEAVLIDPNSVPSLRRALILLETHEFVRAGVTRKLQEQFASTHQIECVWQRPRSISEFPFRSPGTWILPRSYLEWALSEWRPATMCWLWMQPRDSAEERP